MILIILNSLSISAELAQGFEFAALVQWSAAALVQWSAANLWKNNLAGDSLGLGEN